MKIWKKTQVVWRECGKPAKRVFRQVVMGHNLTAHIHNTSAQRYYNTNPHGLQNIKIEYPLSLFFR